MDDTPTLTPPESPPVADEGTPAPQDVVTPVSEPAPLGEGTEPSEEPAEAAPPPPAWASVQEAEEVLELEDMKPILQRREQAAKDTAYDLLKGHMQPLLVERGQAAARAAQGIEDIGITIKRAQDDGLLGDRIVEDVFRTRRHELKDYMDEAKGGAWFQGVEQYLTFLLGNDAPPFTARLQAMRDNNHPDPTFAADAKKKIVASARQEGYDEGFKKGSKTGQTAAQQAKAIKENKDKGANLAPGATGGSASLDAKRRAYHEGKTNVYPG